MNEALRLLCASTGFIMVVGGLWLVYKQKIYLDRETGQVTEFEIPFIGKLKTNAPLLVLFVLGVGAVAYPASIPPVDIRKAAERVRVVGGIEADSFPVIVYAVVKRASVQDQGEFALGFPVVEGEDYELLYVAGGAVIDEPLDLSSVRDGKIRLHAKTVTSGPRYEGDVAPVPREFGGAQ